MKAAIYHGIENVSVEEVAMPECGEHDVIIKNVRSGICGTDIGAYYHGGEAAGIFPEHQFGHEMASVVYKVGSKVDPEIKEGMRVFLNPCLSKRPDCGLSILEICDECGAFSQYVQVQDAKLHYNLFPLPENVSFNEAALIEPFAVGMHGVNRGRATASDRVVIYGAGMIGLCALSACISKGIKEIVVVDVNEWRLKKAKEMGAIPFNAKNGSLKEFLQEKFGANLQSAAGQSAVDIDLYIDTAGSSTVIPEVLGMAKNGSRLVIVALYHQNVTINPYQILGAEMDVVGSFAYANSDIEEVIEALHKKSTPVKQIITHHFKLDQINDAFTQAKDANCALKVVIDHEE